MIKRSHVRQFLAVVDAGSFTRAAEKLFITQSAVSSLIRELEEEIGMPLVQRGRVISLTEAGEHLQRAGQRADLEIDRALKDLRLGGAAQRVVLRVAAGSLSSAALLPPALRQARVLVIEDHPTNQAMMAWRLQQLGVPHVLVDDGQQALDRLAEESFDLVITDCRMPVLDGFDVLAQLQQQEVNTVIIVISADIQPQAVARVLSLGAAGFLQKPLQATQLEQLLLEVGLL